VVHRPPDRRGCDCRSCPDCDLPWRRQGEDRIFNRAGYPLSPKLVERKAIAGKCSIANSGSSRSGITLCGGRRPEDGIGLTATHSGWAPRASAAVPISLAAFPIRPPQASMPRKLSFPPGWMSACAPRHRKRHRALAPRGPRECHLSGVGRMRSGDRRESSTSGYGGDNNSMTPLRGTMSAVASGELLRWVSFTNVRAQNGYGRRIPGVAHHSLRFVDPASGIGSLLLDRCWGDARLSVAVDT
jgi:hypothetical protein